MQLDMGNTIAVWTNVSNTDMRIQFSGFDVEQNTTRTIDGVKCDELYREQMIREQDDEGSYKYFTDQFGYDDGWICPNATTIQINESPFMVKIVDCGEASGDLYAQNILCSPTPFTGLFTTFFKLISTNFEADEYFQNRALQLYNVDYG